MKTILYIFTTLILLINTACDSSKEKDNEQRKSIIAEPQIRAYDKAKGIEDTLQDSEQERKKLMQQQGI